MIYNLTKGICNKRLKDVLKQHGLRGLEHIRLFFYGALVSLLKDLSISEHPGLTVQL
jgi:hypothetical protein